MKQPIAGVAPAEVAETLIMTVWPSIAAYSSGQFLGRLFAVRWPNIYLFRLGNLLALLSIPVALWLYFCRIAPVTGVRYAVTNRRVVVQRGLRAVEARSIALNAFDEIQIDVRPGQSWFQAGDLVFRHSGKEAFRLPGVSRPESWQQVCWKARGAFLGVQQSRQQQPASCV
jgi:hypothetical protein